MEMYQGNGCRKRRASWLFCCCECHLGYHKKPFLDGDSQCLGKTKEKAKKSYTSLEVNTQILPIIKTPQTSNVFSPFFFFLPLLLCFLSWFYNFSKRTRQVALFSSSSKLGANSWTVCPQRHVYPCETTICPDSNYCHAKLVEKRGEARLH